ncbi:MAG: PSD1 and planctomycete cytochrome C domain-containing protein [Gemmataceae bacterium]
MIRFSVPMIVGWALLTIMPAPTLGVQKKNNIDFAHQIVPILKTHCAKCHTNGTYKGRLSMDTRKALLDAKVIVPGKSEKSELYKRITTKDPLDRMPPNGKALSKKEIALVKDWIDQGVPWDASFSFKANTYVAQLKPRRITVPPMKPGLNHPIDRIVDGYFAKQNVTWPEPAADVVLVRRVYLDFIGQLPTPSEVKAFQNDTSKQRVAKLVQRVLAQKRCFAEHWLTFWNDLLRNDYAGTGYIDGGRRQITGWLYQSLLINKPYDQFTRELIHPNQQSEGFIRGIKWRGKVNASQVRELQFAQNVSQVFFGANMKCASCHDSFVDSWKLRDAYGLAAIVSTRKLEIHRCDTPTGKYATPKFLWPELGNINPKLSRDQKLAQLAKLVTNSNNGRFTRTIVNRIWDRMMGRGLVHPVDVMANRPWSDDLLDYLAVYLSDNEYDLKKLIAHIATSNVYQAKTAVQKKELPGKEYVFRGPEVKRMSAEQFVDAIWQITRTSPGRPAARVTLPAFVPSVPKERQFIRASLMRSNLLMRSLGRPNREQVVTTRGEVLTTLQALDLANDQTMYDYLAKGANHLLRAKRKLSSEQIVQDVYWKALGRSPTQRELQTARQLVGSPPTPEGTSDLLWCVMMLPEFQLVR